MRRQPHIHANSLQGLPIAVLSVFKGLALVIPAKAGIQSPRTRGAWTPACAGMKLMTRSQRRPIGSAGAAVGRLRLVALLQAGGDALEAQRVGGGRERRGTARNGVGRSLGVFLMENKHSTQPDFRQQFSRPRRKSPGVAPDGRRRGPDAAPMRRGRRPKAVADHRCGPGNRGLEFGEQGTFRAVAGNFAAARRRASIPLRVGVKSRKIQNP